MWMFHSNKKKELSDGSELDIMNLIVMKSGQDDPFIPFHHMYMIMSNLML